MSILVIEIGMGNDGGSKVGVNYGGEIVIFFSGVKTSNAELAVT